MPDHTYTDTSEGSIRKFEFTHRIKNMLGMDIMPVPVLHVTKERYTIEFTGSDLAMMVKIFMDGLKL